MKQIIVKKTIVYTALLTVVALISTILLYIYENPLVDIFRNTLFILSMCAILFDIGRSISNTQTKKKYIVYTSILVGEISTIVLISKLLGVSTENTLFGAIGVTIIFATLSIMLFNIARAVKNTRPGVGCILFAIIFMFTIGVIVNYILLLSGEQI